jgi:PAS domain S-box-containing protein
VHRLVKKERLRYDPSPQFRKIKTLFLSIFSKRASFMAKEKQSIRKQPGLRGVQEHFRKRAKESARFPEQNKPMSLDEVQSLLYELQLHQEELRIQNEDLRKAQWELAMARDQYMELFEFAPVGYLTLDLEGKITRANLTADDMIGVDRGGLKGKLMASFISEDQQDHFHWFFQKMLHPDEKQIREVTFQRKDGSTFVANMEGRRFEANTLAKGGYFIVLSDISRQKKNSEGSSSPAGASPEHLGQCAVDDYYLRPGNEKFLGQPGLPGNSGLVSGRNGARSFY